MSGACLKRRVPILNREEQYPQQVDRTTGSSEGEFALEPVKCLRSCFNNLPYPGYVFM